MTEMNFYDDPDGWTLIAEIDESRDYEVDQTRIYLDDEAHDYILATASGCSCWSGEWDIERYDTLDQLLVEIGPTSVTERSYNPSLKGAEDLNSQVTEWLNAQR